MHNDRGSFRMVSGRWEERVGFNWQCDVGNLFRLVDPNGKQVGSAVPLFYDIDVFDARDWARTHQSRWAAHVSEHTTSLDWIGFSVRCDYVWFAKAAVARRLRDTSKFRGSGSDNHFPAERVVGHSHPVLALGCNGFHSNVKHSQHLGLDDLSSPSDRTVAAE